LSLPFLAVPVFLTPSGRFLLPLLPGVAWGIGSLAERISERVLARPAVIAGSLAAVGLAVLGTMSTREQASSLVWNATIREVETALTEADLARAERLLLRSSDRDAETPEFQSLLGRLHEAKDDAAAAEEAYRKAVRLGGSPVQLADFLARQGRFSEANACLQSLRAAPPEETAYWLLEGNLAFVAKRWDAAETALRKAEELGGPTQALAFNRALALVGAGRLAEARRQFDRAAAGPDSALAARAMAELDRLRR
jgi:predicted Zn-dependent protease